MGPRFPEGVFATDVRQHILGLEFQVGFVRMSVRCLGHLLKGSHQRLHFGSASHNE